MLHKCLVRNGPGENPHTWELVGRTGGGRSKERAVLCGANSQDRKAEKWRLGNSHLPLCSTLSRDPRHSGAVRRRGRIRLQRGKKARGRC